MIQPVDIGEACAPPAPGELDGAFLFALAAVQPEFPVLFLTEATTEAAPAGGTFLRLALQPLSAVDRQTPVCDPIVLEELLIDETGEMNALLPRIAVAGLANPISGGRIEAEPVLRARFCGRQDFYCGFVQGTLIEPFEIAIEGSSFAMQRLAAPFDVPSEIRIDCSETPANPEIPMHDDYSGCDAP